MDVRALFDERVMRIWQQFVDEYQLSSLQEQQFAYFLQLLIEWSEKINLTTIIAPSAIIKYHFQDSLALGKAVDMHTLSTICDVGTGAGFPGIPLAIKYPNLRIILLEVNHKKMDFLDLVINKLELEQVEIYPRDWRTFLRTTDDVVDLFCARASLQPEELMRMFKPGCRYKDARLVYWAAVDWQPVDKEGDYIKKQIPYHVGNKKRQLVLFTH